MSLLPAAFSQPGPMSGEGRNPNGRPWRGIVEHTPAIWITWLKQMCRRLEIDVERLGLRLYGEPIDITGVELTFGRRHYFLCPACLERREALYFMKDRRPEGPRNESGGRALCRECAHLGYLSQAHRPGSALGDLERLWSRRPSCLPRRHGSSEPAARDREMLLKVFRDALEARALEQIEAVADAIAFEADIERLRLGH